MPSTFTTNKNDSFLLKSPVPYAFHLEGEGGPLAVDEGEMIKIKFLSSSENEKSFGTLF